MTPSDADRFSQKVFAMGVALNRAQAHRDFSVMQAQNTRMLRRLTAMELVEKKLKGFADMVALDLNDEALRRCYAEDIVAELVEAGLLG